MNNIGDRIKKLRTEAGLTLKELANKFNGLYGTKLSVATLSKLEKGTRKIGHKYASLYVEYFNVGYDYIFLGTIPKQNNKEISRNVETIEGGLYMKNLEFYIEYNGEEYYIDRYENIYIKIGKKYYELSEDEEEDIKAEYWFRNMSKEERDMLIRHCYSKR